MDIRYEDFVTETGDEIFRELKRFIGVNAASEPLDFLARERALPVPYRSPTAPTELLGKESSESKLNAHALAKISDETEKLRTIL